MEQSNVSNSKKVGVIRKRLIKEICINYKLSLVYLGILIIIIVLFSILSRNDLLRKMNKELILPISAAISIMFISVIFTFAFLIKQLFTNRRMGKLISSEYSIRLVTEIIIVFVLLICQFIFDDIAFTYLFWISMASVTLFILNLMVCSNRTTIGNFIEKQNKMLDAEKDVTDINRIKRNIKNIIGMFIDFYRNGDYLSVEQVLSSYRRYCIQLLNKNQHNCIDQKANNSKLICQFIQAGFTDLMQRDNIDLAKQTNQKLIDIMADVYNKMNELNVDDDILISFEKSTRMVFKYAAFFDYKSVYSAFFVKVLRKASNQESFIKRLNFLERISKMLAFNNFFNGDRIEYELLISIPKEESLFAFLNSSDGYSKITYLAKHYIIECSKLQELKFCFNSYKDYLVNCDRLNDFVQLLNEVSNYENLYTNGLYDYLLYFIDRVLTPKINDDNLEKELRAIYYTIVNLSISDGKAPNSRLLPKKIDLSNDESYLLRMAFLLIKKEDYSLESLIKRVLSDLPKEHQTEDIEQIKLASHLLVDIIGIAQRLNNTFYAIDLGNAMTSLFKYMSSLPESDDIFLEIFDSLIDTFGRYEEKEKTCPIFIYCIHTIVIDSKLKISNTVLEQLDKKMHDLALRAIEEDMHFVLKYTTNYLGWKMKKMIDDKISQNAILAVLDIVKDILDVANENLNNQKPVIDIATTFSTIIPYYNSLVGKIEKGDLVSNYINNNSNDKALITFVDKACSLHAYSNDIWGKSLACNGYSRKHEEFAESVRQLKEKID